MSKLLARIIRRSKVHLSHLRLGLSDRVERHKSLQIERVSADRQRVQLSFLWSAPHFPKGLLTDTAGHPVAALDPGRAKLGKAAGGRFRHYFWLPVTAGSFEVPRFSGRPMRLVLQNGRPARSLRVAIADVLHQGAHAPPRRLSPAFQAIRATATSPVAQSRFHRAWVLMDRADRADDNAEHFYRYLQQSAEAERIFFVLDPSSPDWPRLQAKGFRLLAFGSDDHIAAVANCEILASSQASVPVFWPAPQAALRDLVRYRFVFLQHGVIINDLSSWLNHLPIDLFVTTTPQEFAAIAGPESPYRYSPQDTVLAGLARHDALLARPRAARWLTVAPTWRNWLTGQIDPKTMQRPRKTGFAQSDYAKAWGGFLADPGLRGVASDKGLSLLLLPHPNLRAYFPDMALPPDVTIYDPALHGTYQDVIAATALCVTDYSSLTMDMAVLDIPQVYYQFDAAEVLGGRHLSGPGYFDYARDGFGPVVTTGDAAVLAVRTGLTKGEDAVYAARRHATLVRRDGQNAARTHAAIREMLLNLGAGPDL